MQQLQTYTDIKQGSEEWHTLRLGKITASCFHKLLGTKKASEKYLYDRVSEILTGTQSDGEDYLKKVCVMHMERGHNYEAVARELYSTYKFTEVEEVGLVQSGKYLTCSPDGLVDTDGMIEIKILDSNNYTMQVIEIKEKGDKAISKEHYVQMQFSLYICKRKWCDYVLYNPKHAVVNRGFSIYRVEINEEMEKRIRHVIEQSIEFINKKVADYYEVTKSPIIN